MKIRSLTIIVLLFSMAACCSNDTTQLQLNVSDSGIYCLANSVKQTINICLVKRRHQQRTPTQKSAFHGAGFFFNCT